MPALHIRLFGSFQAEYGGKPLAGLASARAQSLLAYLLLHRDAPQSRAHLAFQFWPDSSEAQAQANLRYFLHQLRRALPDAAQYLHADKTTLQWRAEAPYTLDVADFARAAAEAENGNVVEPAQALERLLASYSGDLLPGCYDDWIIPAREHLRDLLVKTLNHLSVVLEQRSDYGAAIHGLERVLQHDPLHEATYRHLMRLHALNGDRAGAIRVYRTCVTVLQRELGVEPGSATRETYERLMQTEPPSSAPSAPRSAAVTDSHNLPSQATSFVGREHEISDVKSLLVRTRLLTITGAGGSGKTRLALALAAEFTAARAYTDGVGWVELATVSDPRFVPQAVATALDLHELPGQPLVATLSGHLHAKQYLLLMDNCEHLVDACAELVGILLRRCPSLSMVVTSRVALGIAGETTWLVPPLVQSAAVRLFVERATAALPTFRLTARNAHAVEVVCRRLDGIPLAIELAAARVKLLTVEQIAARLDDALRLLQGSSRSAPARHQTLQAAIDSSHQLLSEGERTLFRRLSVFAGGFTLEAAEAVCSEPLTVHGSLRIDEVLDLLSRLLDQSLVMPIEREQHAEARYRLLETVRQYGSEKLRSAGEREAVLERHAHYYMRLAEQSAREFKGRDQVAWIARVEQDNANLRAALSWSLERGAGDVGLRLAGALWRFWFARGYLAEGRDWLTRLLAQAGPPALTPQYAQAAYGAGVIAWRQGDHAVARTLGERGLAIFQTLEDGEGIGLALVALANVSGAQGDSAAQHAYLNESLAIFRETGDTSGAAAALNNLGELARYEEDYALARRYYAEGLALYQELGNVNGTALVLHNLAHVVQHDGDYSRAASLFHGSLLKYQALGHPGGIAMCLAAAAGHAAIQGQYVRAARLSGVALAAYSAVGATMDGADRVAHDRYMADVRKQLSDDTFAAACAEGRVMAIEQAVQEALATFAVEATITPG